MERQRGPAEARHDGAPATPRPAASIVLLRRGGKHSQRALEVLLLKRSEAAAFMPGVWVFAGGSVDPVDGEGPEGYRACARRELREEAGIVLPPEEELVPFTRWITPEVVSRRFDAWFFLALAPAHSPPKVDGAEITEARLVRARRGARRRGARRDGVRLPDPHPDRLARPAPDLRGRPRRLPRQLDPSR